MIIKPNPLLSECFQNTAPPMWRLQTTNISYCNKEGCLLSYFWQIAMLLTANNHKHIHANRLDKPTNKQKLGDDRKRNGFIGNVVFLGLCKLMQSKCTKTSIGHFEMLTASRWGYSRLLPEAGDFISLFQRNTSLKVFAERLVLSVGAY